MTPIKNKCTECTVYCMQVCLVDLACTVLYNVSDPNTAPIIIITAGVQNIQTGTPPAPLSHTHTPTVSHTSLMSSAIQHI